MIHALAAAVLVLAVLTVLNLMVGLGIVRRLRAHAERLDALDGVAGGPPPSLEPGDRAAEFLPGIDLPARTLVGFFSPSCAPCEELVPRFAELAATMPREQVVAVIAGLPGEAEPMRALLDPVATVFAGEPDGGQPARAFKVEVFPKVFLVDDRRTVLAAGHDLAGVTAVARG